MLIFTIVFILSTITYYYISNILASLLIIALAIFLSIHEYKKNNIINGLMFLYIGFLLPFGISLLKLSNMSQIYNFKIFLLVFITIFTYYIFNKTTILNLTKNNDIKLFDNKEKYINCMFYIELFTFILSIISLLIEIIVLKYVPLFTVNTPHAYSSFHIFGIHYLTVLAKFLPVLSTILLFNCDYKLNTLFVNLNKYKIIIILGYIYPMILSLLLVSRSILFYSIIYVLLYILIVNKNIIKHISLKLKIASVLLFIFAYVIITVFRAHNVEYLNSIFDLKYKLPIFISQPYTYISHNFENLNYLINELGAFSLGKRSFSPIWTLTLIKKFFTLNIYTYPYLIKEELSTCTFLYDIYYDFSIYGVVLFILIISKIFKYFEVILAKFKSGFILKMNPFFIIIYVVLLSYILFSFFQNYFILTNSIIDIAYLYILFNVFDYYVSL